MNYKNLEIENLFGSINKENIYVGNLKKCSEYSENDILEIDLFGITDTFGTISIKSEEYLTDEVLIKFCSNPEVFIPLKDLKKVSSRLKIHQQITKNGIITRKPILRKSHLV